jgi:hypothetical protein
MSSALAVQSPRAVRAGRRPDGARPVTRSCRRAPRGLCGGAGLGEAERGSPSRRRGGGAGKTQRQRRVRVSGELWWPAAPVGRPCSTRGHRRGEGRSAMRMRVAGGVSSP